ncbi:hypothetical protein ACHAXM_011858 [Skeletonema potamos]
MTTMVVAYRMQAAASVMLLLLATFATALVLPSRYKTNANNGRYVRCRECVLPASSKHEMDTEYIDEDLDEFMKEMFEASAAAAYSRDNAESMKELFQTSATIDKKSENNEAAAEAGVADNLDSSKNNGVPSHFIQRERAVGIGGNDGFVYDVNKLKRNLVQESVRGYKQELLVLLGDGRQVVDSKKVGKQKNNMIVPKWKKDRDDLIEERLASLVQNNPVSTTTDSNLLDGDWAFAFQTNSAKTILDTSRFLLSKTKRLNSNHNSGKGSTITNARGGPWRFRSGKTENPFRSSTRQVFLENLSDDDDAHIIDRTSMLGGLFKISRRYGVYGLTRTSIDLDLMSSESKIFGMPVKRKDRDDFIGTKYGSPLEIQVLYLDNDLCVCTTGQGLDGPVHVYTKSDLWATTGAKRKVSVCAKWMITTHSSFFMLLSSFFFPIQQMRLLVSWFFSLQSPLRIRQRLSNAFAKVNKKSLNIDGSDLQAINIGEIDITDDGRTAEEPSWDGEDDPFYHLTPGERMEVLRTMSLQDIYKSAVNRKEQNQKQKRRFGSSRKGAFKRPDNK